MKKAIIILIWIIGSMFIAAGILKLSHLDPMSAAIFDKANYPSWLFYLTGFSELIGGIFLIIRKTRKFGALLIIGIMLGVISTHFHLKDAIGHVIVPTLIILFSTFIIVKFKQE